MHASIFHVVPVKGTGHLKKYWFIKKYNFFDMFLFQLQAHEDYDLKSWVLTSCMCYGRSQREKTMAIDLFTPVCQVRDECV